MSLQDVIALYADGRLDEAEHACRALIRATPTDAPAHNALGAILLALGRVSHAVRAIEAAIELQPSYGRGYNNLGNAFRAAGRTDDAIEAFRQATVLEPDLQTAHANLGIVLSENGDRAAAVAPLEIAIRLDPRDSEAKLALGAILRDLRRTEEAVSILRDTVALAPDSAEAHSNLGTALADGDQIGPAIAAYTRAIELRPTLAAAHYNLGKAMVNQGRISEGIAAYERALVIDPKNRDIVSNLLFALNYDDGLGAEAVFRRHKELSATFGTPREVSKVASRKRPLRVGYLSPDLRDHSVPYFLLALIEAHDRARVQVTCYHAADNNDAITARIRAASDRWRDVSGATTRALRDQIRTDGIDILVDLAGHTGRNRLDVFASRAAPIQVSWLGYPNTSGLSAMDARLTDSVADPPGQTDALHTERLIRLPESFLCYRPDEAPPVAPLPALANGFMTFGSFNNLPKIGAATIAAWSAVLRAVPNARLLLKSRHLADQETKQRYIDSFERAGISKDRIDARAAVPNRRDHLALYGEIDIALDPFPYNGTTTTCEALWMGVPVVTLRGDRHAARVGASLLTTIGKTEWIGDSVGAFVEIARCLADNPKELARERGRLRDHLRRSPLRDETGFARRVESVYEDLADASSSPSSSSSSPSN